MLSSLTRHAKRQTGRLCALVLAAGLAVTMAGIGPADAHGEKSQAAFLRMRTLNWYDVVWSKTNVTVNEEYEITGKLHIMNSWPAAIEVPNQCFLNTGQPGAMAARLGVWVGAPEKMQFTPRSMRLEVGKTYAFRILLKARRPGHWHTHVQLSVKTGGPIPGPGQYIDIKGNFSDYTDEVKLLNGTTVDIETYGIGKIYMWHLFWIIVGGAWILYWFGKRGFIGRFAWVASGKAEEIITPQERMVGAVTLLATLLVVIIFYAITVSGNPNTIPLQAGDFRNIQALENEVDTGPITIKYLNGTYKVPGRELDANFKITNDGKEPLRIGEFATAGLRFLNPDVFTSKVVYPDYLLADRGLSLNDNSPIAPGETRDVAVTVQDARWDTERLSGLAYDVDSSFAGVLFFFSPSGARYPFEVGGPVIPQFANYPESTREDTVQKQPTDRMIKIYYATNRAADDYSRIINYTGDRADKLSFGIMQVRVPDNHKAGIVEYDPNYTDIRIDQTYMQNNFVIRSITAFERGEFINRLRGDKRDTALVFVHGYNSSFDDGAFRLAQIVWDGQLYNFPIIPILFSWPSKNNEADYPYDGESAEIAVDYFIELLQLLQRQVGIKTVHIIAHSMGNRIVLNAISKAVDTLKSGPLGELVFAAADVDRKRFIQVINEVQKIPHGMTLYASAADAPLWWSGKFASDDRAGTVTEAGPIVVEGVESIDMTSTNPARSVIENFWRIDPLGLNTHNTFVSPIITDIALLVGKGEHPPSSRTPLIRGVPEGTPKPKYWRYPN